LRDALRDLETQESNSVPRASDDAQRAEDAAKREEILNLLGTTI
jgi:hypothetical protein